MSSSQYLFLSFLIALMILVWQIFINYGNSTTHSITLL